jgi:hypothetical protein
MIVKETQLMPVQQYKKNSRRYGAQFNLHIYCLAVDSIRAVQRPRAGSLPYNGGVAAEPGLDYKTIDVEGFDNPVTVTVTDYSSQGCVSKKMELHQNLEEFFDCGKPSWAKVRWINVDGLNWQCIKILASKYNLHRLAIEDLLSVQRTKIDLYQDRICFLLRRLIVQIFMCVY